MDPDQELTKIVRELREQTEYVSMLVRPPHTSDDRTPMTDTWQLRDDTTLEQLCQATGELVGRVEALQRWLDEHGPQELKDPHRGEGGWTGYGPVRGEPRSWWRRSRS